MFYLNRQERSRIYYCFSENGHWSTYVVDIPNVNDSKEAKFVSEHNVIQQESAYLGLWPTKENKASNLYLKKDKVAQL